MKVLKISKALGYFVNRDGQDVEIDKIDKEEILRLVDVALKQDVEMDEFDEEKIKNPAHQIVYKNVYRKLKSLCERREEFKDESETMYLEEYEKYRQDAPTQEE